ncbi:hypothetical protein EDB89DRAFT_1907163 [Lactarius sanguifluus]|nr:hypothetical protein EDB89DRAFT_1907163 [Lactarius sanguifluus]
MSSMSSSSSLPPLSFQHLGSALRRHFDQYRYHELSLAEPCPYYHLYLHSAGGYTSMQRQRQRATSSAFFSAVVLVVSSLLWNFIVVFLDFELLDPIQFAHIEYYFNELNESNHLFVHDDQPGVYLVYSHFIFHSEYPPHWQFQHLTLSHRPPPVTQRRVSGFSRFCNDEEEENIGNNDGPSW